MPARERLVGPEVSRHAGLVIKRQRETAGWRKSDLSRIISELGEKMSAATISQVEGGIKQSDGTFRVRLLSLDEAELLCRVLQIPVSALLPY